MKIAAHNITTAEISSQWLAVTVSYSL